MIWLMASLANATTFGGEHGELILTATDVHAEVHADLAVVQVHQVFENPFDVALDATYAFPLPTGAAVQEMVITCGERVIRGEVHSKAEARKRYDDAVANGQRAALLEQQRPNLFLQKVGGICPGETVEVDLQYVEDIGVGDGVHDFVFPTTTGHRYQPSDLREAPLVEANRAERSLSLELTVHTGATLGSIWSDAYPIEVLEETEDSVRIALTQPAVPDSDVDVHWKLAVDEPKLSVLTAKDADGDAYVGLTLHPPVPDAAPDARARELVFVLDASCSMSGQPWEHASDTVRLAMSALRPGEKFNLVQFSDAAGSAFDAPVAATPENVARAERWLQYARSGGGTNMATGVLEALNMPGDPDALRMVVLLTDGYIGTERELFRTVSGALGENDRIFGLGIGSSVNRHLIEGLSHHGRGASLFQLPETPMDETIRSLYRRLDRPVLTDIDVDWGPFEVDGEGPIADLFVGQPLQVTGRVFGASSGTVRVSGLLAGKPWSTEVDIDLAEATVHESLPTLWARRRIEAWGYDLEATHEAQEERITALALRHHLVSDYTSLVAIDTEPNGCGTGAAYDVPLLQPRGTESTHAGVFGAVGMGGLGSRGSGIGGGGSALGLGGLGSGYGKGGGSFGSKASSGSTTTGTPKVLGSLDRNLIAGVIRRHLNQIRYCYQRELTKDPTLAGKVVVRFVIAADGNVAHAKIGSSTLSNQAVESCIKGRFVRMRFPVPTGGGQVVVSYPLEFTP